MRLWKCAVRCSVPAFLAILSVLFLAVPATSATGKTPRTLSVVNSPSVTGNFLVDQDHGLAFSQNKQNEPAITRDPLTGVLIAGANDEIDQPLCAGTSAPLSSPCPFKQGRQTSGFYVSSNNEASWTGGYLPGYDNAGIRRASG